MYLILGIKPEPIMLLIFLLFIPEFPVIFTHYSLFIPMLSPIIILFLKFDCIICKIAYGSLISVINIINSF